MRGQKWRDEKERPRHHLSRLISGYLVGGKKFHNKNFNNHSTSIDGEIMRRDDGNVPIARELSNALQAKISCGLLTPRQRGVLFWLANPCNV